MKKLIVFFFLLYSNLLTARTVYYGQNTETLGIVYGSQVILRFETPVKTISNANLFSIKPADEEQPDYSVLVIEAKRPSGDMDVNFILANADIVKLRIAILPKTIKGKTDSLFDLKSRKNVLQSPDNQSLPKIEKLDLMAAMIRGDQVAGFEVLMLDREVQTGKSDLKAVLKKVYSSETLKGYVYQITNTSKTKRYFVDIKRLKFGRPSAALLGYASRVELSKSGDDEKSAEIIIVATPESHAKDITLPFRMASVQEK